MKPRLDKFNIPKWTSKGLTTTGLIPLQVLCGFPKTGVVGHYGIVVNYVVLPLFSEHESITLFIKIFRAYEYGVFTSIKDLIVTSC